MCAGARGRRGRNAHITVRLKSLLDEVYLEMTPGTNSAPVLPDGGTIPSSQVTTNVGLDQILNTFTPSIRSDLQVWLQLRFFARYAIPIVDYLYAYRQEFVESWPKAAAATNGLLYDPGSGHYLHYLRAPAVVPSEANAFAADRQPYSRSDAYMSPGGIADFKGDKLQDFDCAFTKDAVTVPAIPGGEPACIQQAPWTFEGKTADYPQLKPAP